ncbi:MAG: sensor histidine kinase [Bacteroidales bacterium]|nr:sensor histidine kinase [Bacteroidales bacterium]
MIIKIALILSVVIQFVAAVLAISLIKRTKTHIAWWLISIGFLAMAVRLFLEVITIFNPEREALTSMLYSWLGVIISLLTLISLMFIRRLFNAQNKYEEFRTERESEVLSAIIKTEENERSRFAKELHDGLGPLLSSIKMSVSAIKKQMDGKNDGSIIENTEKLIDESIFTIKEISNNISPHILNNFGLYKALQSFITKIQVSNNIDIMLNSNIGQKRFNYNVEVVFYRIICELITNTLKHASARRITIDLFETDNELILEYIDDGKGFSPEKAEQTGTGMGLSNMRSRVNSLNGRYEAKSKKGMGVCFNISVKVNQ